MAYADDVAILVSGQFPSVMSEIMERTLKIVDSWAISCSLSVNPEKTDLMLFTNKTKLPNFNKPRFRGTELDLSMKVKYLGVILDPKLNWKPNIEERARKVALYAAKRMLGNRWGLKPRIVHWMYTAIVQPIISYGALVWWPALTKDYVVKKLGGIQRSAAASVTGAMRSCPKDVLNVLLDLLPIDICVPWGSGRKDRSGTVPS